jgi:NADH-quinone oxidoreductase subunit J
MEITVELIVFLVLAVIIVTGSILAVTTKRLLRSATYLLFVLFAVAGIYFMLNYTFLGAVQLVVYAGGVSVLYIFSIFLTSTQEERLEKPSRSRKFAGLIASIAGLGISLFVILKHKFTPSMSEYGELPVKEVGHALLGSGKYQYVLPFEVISILLLACIIGGVLIARKR